MLSNEEYTKIMTEIVEYLDAAIDKALDELDLDDVMNIPEGTELFEFIKPYSGEKEYQQMAFLANHLIQDHGIPYQKVVKDMFDLSFQKELTRLQHKYSQVLQENKENS